MGLEALDIKRIVSAMLNPLRHKISMAIGRCVISAAADDTLKIQSLQADFLESETLSDLERFQNYGFTSVPLEGAEGVGVFVGANRDHGIIIAVDDRRYRLKGLEAGEVALYTDEGDKLHIKRGGALEITMAASVTIATPTANINCENATITASTKAKLDSPAIELGSTAVEKLIKGNVFQSLFNAHTHTGNLGAPTSPPITPLDGTELSSVSKTE